MKIHPVFHVSLLEPFHHSTIRTQPPEPVIPEIIDGEEEWPVEKILDSRKRYRKLQYLVKWKGYPDTDNSWEPYENVKNCEQLLQDFHTKHPHKPKS
jgi:hypothetical protein